MARISEIKRIKIGPSVSDIKNPFIVGWRNSRAGMNWWVFSCDQSFESDSDEVETFVQDFDSLADVDSYEIQRGSNSSTIVSLFYEDLTIDEVNAIRFILDSPEVYWYPVDWATNGKTNNGRLRLIPVTRSLQLYRTDDSLHRIEFKVRFPKSFSIIQ